MLFNIPGFESLENPALIGRLTHRVLVSSEHS